MTAVTDRTETPYGELRRGRYPTAAELVARYAADECPTPWKHGRYLARTDALSDLYRLAARAHIDGRDYTGVVPYECSCGVWHLGHPRNRHTAEAWRLTEDLVELMLAPTLLRRPCAGCGELFVPEHAEAWCRPLHEVRACVTCGGPFVIEHRGGPNAATCSSECRLKHRQVKAAAKAARRQANAAPQLERPAATATVTLADRARRQIARWLLRWLP